jgi:hypothetical protein
MTPTSSNHRKRVKSPAHRRHRPELAGTPVVCGCPACRAREREIRHLVTLLADTGRTMLDVDDPVLAEVGAAMIAATEQALGGTFLETFEGALPRLERSAPREALAVGLTLRALASGRIAALAGELADDLAGRGVARPAWAEDLGAPVTGEEFHALHDDRGGLSILAAVFRRAGRQEGFLVAVDADDCDEAVDITLVGGPMAEVLESLHAAARRDGVRLRTESLRPAEFRWRAENALDARRLHEEAGDVPDASGVLELLGLEADDEDDDELFGGEEDEAEDLADEAQYAAMEVLLRSRLAALPEPGKPPARHGTGADDCARDLVESAALRILAGSGGTVSEVFRHAARAARTLRWRAPAAEPPAKPDRGGAAAPGYQLKASLRGAWPAIWRRVEVPADLGLDELHHVLRLAFGWRDLRLHVFETPWGTFGARDPGLGWLAEAEVSVEQVLRAEGDGIRYTYDLSDDWEHDVVLEKVLPAGVEAPRCTGGRRAAPPEDCGGVYGYRDLLEILGDPKDVAHDEKLDWLGLHSAREFDPDRFDAEEVTARLTARR